MPSRARRRTIEPPVMSIVAATDLGNVEVAKHGNLYLLTDPRGDVRIDGRGLGLYELDTRVLSTSMLRLNGVPLTLLRGPYLRDGVDTIQLTNPELRRNPDDKRVAGSSLARRELSVTRTRQLDGEPPRAGRHRQLLGARRAARARARARRRHGRHLRGPRLSADRARHAAADRPWAIGGPSSATTASMACSDDDDRDRRHRASGAGGRPRPVARGDASWRAGGRRSPRTSG